MMVFQGGILKPKSLRALLITILFVPVFALAQEQASQSAPPQGGDFSNNPEAVKVPQNVILVKVRCPAPAIPPLQCRKGEPSRKKRL